MKQLAINHRYDEAEKLYNSLKEHLAFEDSEYEGRRYHTIQNLLKERKRKHANEMNSTLAKIENGLNELEMNKDAERVKLLKKISFLKRNLENLQIQEYNSFERDVKNFNKDANVMMASHYSNLIKSKNVSYRSYMLK